MQAKDSKSVAVVVTTLNEEATIEPLLNCLQKQTHKPQQVIVVDGGSSDATLKILKNFQSSHKKFPLQVIVAKGNRSLGRNEGIANVKVPWVAITDAGCCPESGWLEELVSEQQRSKAEVIAGYYKAYPQTNFERAMVPYALVMPERVDEDNFLPATRSMLIAKQTWLKAGKFDERLPDNEDYAFAKKLQKQEIKMSFAKNAVVVWQPRATLRDFTKMIFRFARGDMEAGIVRPKVLLIFLRYLVVLWIFVATLRTESPVILVTLLLGLATYIVWAIDKNYTYVRSGWHWLPVLQISSDLAVMAGSIAGLYRGLKNV